MEGITVHCVVRNEPFIYYAVKSVYDYVDTILLYDTGSYDKYTLLDIQRLIDEDNHQKIIYKQVPIDVDETKWTASNWIRQAYENKGKKGVWYVRNLQIKDTKTKYFMILDGDEVYYSKGVQSIVDVTKNWPDSKICGFVSLIWFNQINSIYNTSKSGRIFLTDKISMSSQSPGEMHLNKSTGQRILPNSDFSFSVPNNTPFAHFETWLKPWRRTVRAETVQEYKQPLPEVMVNDMSFVERFNNEISNK